MTNFQKSCFVLFFLMFYEELENDSRCIRFPTDVAIFLEKQYISTNETSVKPPVYIIK